MHEDHSRARGFKADGQPSNLEHNRLMIDKFCGMYICAVFHKTSPGELVAYCLVMRD